jgi:hypothetical protein
MTPSNPNLPYRDTAQRKSKKLHMPNIGAMATHATRSSSLLNLAKEIFAHSAILSDAAFRVAYRWCF